MNNPNLPTGPQDGAQRMSPLNETRPMPPAPPPQSPPPLPPARRPRKARRDDALYLPIWSVAVMLIFVFVVAFGLFGLVLSLGGQGGPGGSPRIVIITALPSDTPLANGTPAQQILQPQATSAVAPGTLPTFALEGPTLPPVILSPTPLSITLGATVIVNADSLNVRANPGTDQDLLFTAPAGTAFRVIEGPMSATGYTWWRIQSMTNPLEAGWAAAQFLDVDPGAAISTVQPT